MPRLERRQAPRAKTQLLTAYRCLDNGNVTTTGFGRTLNLSRIGALLETPDPFPVGQAVSLEFLLDNNKLVTVEGDVTRVDQAKPFYNLAIKFSKLTPTARRLIDLQSVKSPTRAAKKAKPKTRTAKPAKPKSKPKK